MMETVSVSKFKATCPALLDRIKRTGQTIIIAGSGEPIAQVEPPPMPEKPALGLGCFQSRGKIVGDIVAPAADEEEWEVLQMRDSYWTRPFC